MRLPASILLTVALVSTSFGGPAPGHAGEVNMSRLRITAVMPAQPTGGAFPLVVTYPVDLTVLDAFCGDGDGCTARVQMHNAALEVRGGQRVFFKSGTHWTTDVDTFDFVDGDNFQQPVLETTLAGDGSDTCLFSDFNYNTGLDNAPGFTTGAVWWAAQPTPGFTCVLTLID